MLKLKKLLFILSYLAMFRKSSWGTVFRQNIQPNTGQFLSFMVAIQPQQLKFSDCTQWSTFYAIARCNLNSKESAQAKCDALFTSLALNGSVKRVWTMTATRFSNKLPQNSRLFHIVIIQLYENTGELFSICLSLYRTSIYSVNKLSITCLLKTISKSMAQYSNAML